MSLRLEDREAIVGLAGDLQVDPGTLGGLMELESNMDPNIWGGAGGKYRGLIQFGPGARSEVGLPDREMTIAEQVPFVKRYFEQRGFKPGEHGARELYRTVLVGNPDDSGTDSFGTNSDKAAKRMQPGGDLYERAVKKLGGGGAGAGGPKPPPTTERPRSSSSSSGTAAGLRSALDELREIQPPDMPELMSVSTPMGRVARRGPRRFAGSPDFVSQAMGYWNQVGSALGV